MNPAVEVLVVNRVFIMPNASGRVRYFVADETDSIDSRGGFELVDGRSGPCPDGGLLSLGGKAAGGKSKWTAGSGDIVSSIGDVVIHVALAGICLAPVILVRRDVLPLRIISRPGVQRRIQVIDLTQNPVRGASVGMAGVIV